MTQDYQTGLSSDPQGSTTQTAKDQAAGVAHSAAQSGAQLVGEARSQAGQVGREATQQAKTVLDQGRTQLAEQAAQQQKKVAGGVRSFGEELHSMARASSEPGMASDLAHQVASRADAIASWLEDREPGAIVDEVKAFARNKPGTFLAIAAGAGLLAGRLTRGIKDAADDPALTSGTSTGSGSHRLPGAPSMGHGLEGSAYGAGTAHGTDAALAATPSADAQHADALYAGTQADAQYSTDAQYSNDPQYSTDAQNSTGTAGLYSDTSAQGTGTEAQGTSDRTSYGLEDVGTPGVYGSSDAGSGGYLSGGDEGDYSTGTPTTSGSSDDTMVYGTRSPDSDDTPDSYGGGTENPPTDTPAYGTQEAGVFGGGTTEVPEREADLDSLWPPVHGEGEQR